MNEPLDPPYAHTHAEPPFIEPLTPKPATLHRDRALHELAQYLAKNEWDSGAIRKDFEWLMYYLDMANWYIDNPTNNTRLLHGL